MESSGARQKQKIVSRDIIHKVFETNCSFDVKQQNTGVFLFLFFTSFSLVSAMSSFWEEDWTRL